MSTITKEQAKDLRNAFECWQQDYDPVEDKEQYDMFGLGMVAMDTLLASLEAEPVACMGNGALYHSEEEARADARYILQPLYTAHPAPVAVPDEVSWEDVPEEITEYDMALASAWAHGFNQCRAAMLQGVEPVTTAYKLPEDFDFDRFNDVVWLEAVASNPHMHSTTTSTIAMVALELNKRIEAGNSPVIPDAYDIEAFGVFRATEGENGLMMDVDRFHFETDSCPQIGKDKFVPKFAIQAIINRLQKHCDNMEADELIDIFASAAAPQQEG